MACLRSRKLNRNDLAPSLEGAIALLQSSIILLLAVHVAL